MLSNLVGIKLIIQCVLGHAKVTFTAFILHSWTEKFNFLILLGYNNSQRYRSSGRNKRVFLFLKDFRMPWWI